MKTVVIYKSKYGAAKQYAEWIADTLDCPVCGHSDFSAKEKFDLVIYGGGVFAGSIEGIGTINKKTYKHLIVFTVGLNDPLTTYYTEIIKDNLLENMLSPNKIFHLRGRLDCGKLSFSHKALMKMLKGSLSKKKPSELTENENVLLDACEKSVDFVDKAAIAPIVEYVQGFGAEVSIRDIGGGNIV